MRISENGITGSAEEISSDIVLPETRIPSTPEVGSESNSGDVQTEWNIGEQDAWFAGLFGSSWHSEGGNDKSISLGKEGSVNYPIVSHSFSLFEKFPQTPVAWQHYKKEFVNSLSMDFQTDSFVKLTWNFMGSNNPKMEDDFPVEGVTPTILTASKTKSFITKAGMWLKIGDTKATVSQIRQCPSMKITIANNLERTPALGEDESIENSLGNFDINGTLDVYNVDALGKSLYNDAVEGKDKVIQVCVSRKIASTGITHAYTLTLNVHLGAPTKSRNGNKLQFSVPFKVNDDTDLKLEYTETSDSTVDAETPVFTTPLPATASDETSVELDGTATVTDGGTLTYQWYKDDVEIEDATSATYTATESGTFKVVVTNTNASATGSTTATANGSCVVTIE